MIPPDCCRLLFFLFFFLLSSKLMQNPPAEDGRRLQRKAWQLWTSTMPTTHPDYFVNPKLQNLKTGGFLANRNKKRAGIMKRIVVIHFQASGCGLTICVPKFSCKLGHAVISIHSGRSALFSVLGGRESHLTCSRFDTVASIKMPCPCAAHIPYFILHCY